MKTTNNPAATKEKKVEYIELIYDLIFVYMVGRDNALLENVQNGFIAPAVFAIYICSTLSIIQIWNFTTFYINMFGRNGLREHIFLLVNMYLMYFLGEATRMNAGEFVAQYHIAWGLILVNIGLQYLLELRNHKEDFWNRGVIIRMSSTLFTEAAIVFIAAFLNNTPALVLSFAAVGMGVVLTFISRHSGIGRRTDFMHLTERAMLYVMFTFGEMIIAIAGYFTGGGSYDVSAIYYSLMAFLITAGLFSGYEIIYNHLLDREGEYNGMGYMMIHIFIVFALNNITVSFTFMREPAIAFFPKMLMLTLSIVAYFFFLFLLGFYFKIHCKPDKKFAALMSLLSVVFVAVMMLLRRRMAVNILITVIYVFAVFGAIYWMKLMQDKYWMAEN